MTKIARIRPHRDLNDRRPVTLELPEFLLRAMEQRIAEANDRADADGQVTIEHLVELQLAEGLSVAEVALLEHEVPGISAAVSRWLDEVST
jgi:hypothetical protein